MNRSNGSISRTFYRLSGGPGTTGRSKGPPLSDSEINEIAKMRETRTPWTKIAASIGKPARNLARNFRHHTSDKVAANYMDPGAGWSTAAVQQLMHMRDVLEMSWSDISSTLNRTVASIQSRYALKRTGEPLGPQRWTTEDDQALNMLRKEQHVPWKDVSLALPGRSPCACRKRFAGINSATPSSSRSFCTAVPNRYDRPPTRGSSPPIAIVMSQAIVRPIVRRSAFEIHRHLLHTKTHSPGQGKPYTAEENKIILRRRRDHVSFPNIATELGRSSASGVRSRFYKLIKDGELGPITRRVVPLSDADYDNMAQKRAAGTSWLDIARPYNRTPKSCCHAFLVHTRLKLHPHLKNLPARRWTDADVARLLECRDRLKQSWFEIADSLGRSPRSVASKYSDVTLDGKVDRPTNKDEYSSSEDDTILYLRDFLGLAWTAIHLRAPHRTKDSLRKRYFHYLGPKRQNFPERTVERFTPGDYTMLHDLKGKQQLSWDAVQERMKKWTIGDLQDHYALLIKWPPSSSPSSFKAPQQARTFTTVTESSMRFFGTSARTIPSSPLRGTFWTSMTRANGQCRSLHALESNTKRIRRARFSAGEIERMIDLKKEGNSYPEIALELDIASPSSCRTAIRRWAIQNKQENVLRASPSATGYDHERIKEMKSSGMTWREVGSHFKANPVGIAAKYRRIEETMALPPGSRGLSKHGEIFSADDVRSIFYARDGLQKSWPEIGHQLGRSPQSVEGKYHQVRLKTSVDRPSMSRKMFSQAELDSLYHFRFVQKLPWIEIQFRMPTRSMSGLKNRLASMLSTAQAERWPLE